MAARLRVTTQASESTILTAHIGKWHLGRGNGMSPTDQGFDDSLLMASGFYLDPGDPEVVNSRGNQRIHGGKSIMKKFLFYLVLVLLTLGAAVRLSIEFAPAQNMMLQQFTRAVMLRAATGLPEPDSLRVFVCGSASPLGNTGRAQACIAVLTPQHFYIVDSGAGSTANVTSMGLPLQRLRGVFVTHFHSDHIAELYEVNLASWVQGRPEPLRVYAPKGVGKLVDALNEVYEMDREYRITHHGEALLAPELGMLIGEAIEPGVVLQDGDLTVTAYTAAHSPAKPAVGYRFDYRGRSVVISGDSNVTGSTRLISAGADLLLHDALAEPVVKLAADAATAAGLSRQAKIMNDVLDYHASTDSIIELADDTDIGMVAFYHLVPAPQNIIVEKVFERNLPDNFVVTKDGDWFELPISSDETRLIRP